MTTINHEARNREDKVKAAGSPPPNRRGSYATPTKNLRQTRKRPTGRYGSMRNRFTLSFDPSIVKDA